MGQLRDNARRFFASPAAKKMGALLVPFCVIGCAGANRDYARIEPTIGPSTARKGPFAGLGKKPAPYLQATTTTDAPDALATIDGPPGSSMAPVISQPAAPVGETNIAVGEPGGPPTDPRTQVPATAPLNANLAQQQPQYAAAPQMAPGPAYNSPPSMNQPMPVQAPYYNSPPAANYGQQTASESGWYPVGGSPGANQGGMQVAYPPNQSIANGWGNVIAGNPQQAGNYWPGTAPQNGGNSVSMTPYYNFQTPTSGSTFIPAPNSGNAYQMAGYANSAPGGQGLQQVNATSIPGTNKLLSSRLNDSDTQDLIKGRRPRGPENDIKMSDGPLPGRRDNQMKTPPPPSDGDGEFDSNPRSRGNSNRSNNSNLNYDNTKRRDAGRPSEPDELLPNPNRTSPALNRGNKNDNNDEILPPPSGNRNLNNDNRERGSQGKNKFEDGFVPPTKKVQNGDGVRRQVENERKESPKANEGTFNLPGAPAKGSKDKDDELAIPKAPKF